MVLVLGICQDLIMNIQESGDDSVLCVNMVEGGPVDDSVDESSCDDGDDSVLCVDVVEAPPAL